MPQRRKTPPQRGVAWIRGRLFDFERVLPGKRQLAYLEGYPHALADQSRLASTARAGMRQGRQFGALWCCPLDGYPQVVLGSAQTAGRLGVAVQSAFAIAFLRMLDVVVADLAIARKVSQWCIGLLANRIEHFFLGEQPKLEPTLDVVIPVIANPGGKLLYPPLLACLLLPLLLLRASRIPAVQ
jgi:hypothetical protein